MHGDGLQSRDFTYITDVVAANLAAAGAPADACAGRAYNIARRRGVDACSTCCDILGELLGVEPAPAVRRAARRRRAAQPRRRDAPPRATSGSAHASASTTASGTTVDWLRTLG